MWPRIAGVPSYAACLLLAVAVLLAAAPRAGRRLGVGPGPMLLATALLTAAAMAGGKLYWRIETGAPTWGDLWRGYRYAGALPALLALLPAAARLTGRRAPALALGDALAPLYCLALSVVRLGCFLNGCCCGRTCALPWAVHFPAGAEAWTHQVFAHLIPVSARISLPVHPLQLYVALLSAAIGAAGLWRLPRRRFDGEVLLGSLLAFAAGEAALYGLRYQYSAPTHLLLAALSAAAALAFVAAARRARRIARRGGSP
jgi:phosphatidylglycerol:prolipoprotein diacylglycerol transferase